MKKCLLVVDVHDWAFRRIADQVANNFCDSWRFDIKAYTEIKEPIECDLMIVFWWASIAHLVKKVKAKKIVLCFYDHYTWKFTDDRRFLKICLDSVHHLVFANEQMLEEFRGFISMDGIPCSICEDGVDLMHFKPPTHEVPEDSLFKVCWAGNSKTFARGLKGVDLLEAACAQMGVCLELADRKNGGMIPFKDMPNFYQNASATVIPTLKEGTPNPLLESLACGRPVAITNVGLAPKLIQEGVNGTIIDDRSVEGIIRAIDRLRKMDMRSARIAARASVLNWDWPVKMKQWERIFQG